MCFGTFLTCGPNEVIVVAGCRGTKLVRGGRIYRLPCSLEKVHRLSLNTMTIQIESPKVYTLHGVPISVLGVAQIKVHSKDRESLLRACELFLCKSENEIRYMACATLEGHQRAIMGRMTVEEIYKDKQKFSDNVYATASADLLHMGLWVISYTLKDVSDDEGYLFHLGQARTGQVKRDARIGEAQFRSEAAIKTYLAEENEKKSVLKNWIDTEMAKRDFLLRKANFDIEVNTKKAEADLAYQLQVAKTTQRIRDAEMTIQIVEKEQRTQLAEQEMNRREKELQAIVRRPADAEKFRLEKLAVANHQAYVLDAEAESAAVRLKGEGDAYAIEIKAKAEAEQMTKKAEAFQEYTKPGMIEMVVQTIPKIAAELTTPLSQMKKVTMVSYGDGQVGPSKLTNDVIDFVLTIPKFIEDLTSVDVFRKLHGGTKNIPTTKENG